MTHNARNNVLCANPHADAVTENSAEVSRRIVTQKLWACNGGLGLTGQNEPNCLVYESPTLDFSGFAGHRNTQKLDKKIWTTENTSPAEKLKS
jgi:hypothetical protein